MNDPLCWSWCLESSKMLCNAAIVHPHCCWETQAIIIHSAATCVYPGCGTTTSPLQNTQTSHSAWFANNLHTFESTQIGLVANTALGPVLDVGRGSKGAWVEAKQQHVEECGPGGHEAAAANDQTAIIMQCHTGQGGAEGQHHKCAATTKGCILPWRTSTADTPQRHHTNLHRHKHGHTFQTHVK